MSLQVERRWEKFKGFHSEILCSLVVWFFNFYARWKNFWSKHALQELNIFQPVRLIKRLKKLGEEEREEQKEKEKTQERWKKTNNGKREMNWAKPALPTCLE